MFVILGMLLLTGGVKKDAGKEGFSEGIGDKDSETEEDKEDKEEEADSSPIPHTEGFGGCNKKK